MVSRCPRTTMVAVVVVVVMLLLTASGPGRCESDTQYDDEENKDDCHPEMADTCFVDVNDNLMCNLGKPRGMNCANRDAHDLCNGMNDTLMCCEQIMDSCKKDKGFNTFHVWLTGLRSVHHHLCQDEDHLSLVTDLLEGSKCFRLKKFINCVEERAQITHVADLLTTNLDLHECNQLQVSVAACIEDGEKNKGRCRGTAQALTEALIVFFTSTACGHAPPPPSACPAPSNVSGAGHHNTTTTTSGTTTTTTTTTTITTTNNNNTNSEASNTAKNSNTNNKTNNINLTNNSSSSSSSNSNAQAQNNSISGSKNTTTSSSNSNSNSNSNNSSSSSKETQAQRTCTTPVACQQTQKDLSSSGTPMASTVVVTVLVTVVVVGVAAVLLLKRGVLLVRTDLDRRLIGFSDDDANSAYDRF